MAHTVHIYIGGIATRLFLTLMGAETKGTTHKSVHKNVHRQKSINMLSRNGTEKATAAIDTKPPDMSGYHMSISSESDIPRFL